VAQSVKGFSMVADCYYLRISIPLPQYGLKRREIAYRCQPCTCPTHNSGSHTSVDRHGNHVPHSAAGRRVTLWYAHCPWSSAHWLPCRSNLGQAAFHQFTVYTVWTRHRASGQLSVGSTAYRIWLTWPQRTLGPITGAPTLETTGARICLLTGSPAYHQNHSTLHDMDRSGC
jgi:hypothetical protein